MQHRVLHALKIGIPARSLIVVSTCHLWNTTWDSADICNTNMSCKQPSFNLLFYELNAVRGMSAYAAVVMLYLLNGGRLACCDVNAGLSQVTFAL